MTKSSWCIRTLTKGIRKSLQRCQHVMNTTSVPEICGRLISSRVTMQRDLAEAVDQFCYVGNAVQKYKGSLIPTQWSLFNTTWKDRSGSMSAILASVSLSLFK